MSFWNTVKLDEEVRQRELENCTFVKTVLMILIVVYHSVLFWSGSWFSVEPAIQMPSLVIFAKWLNSFHVYAFVLISGYLFSYLRYEKRKYNHFLSFVGVKAKRLLIPYLFVACIWVIPIGAYFFKYDFSTIFEKFILATAPGQLWFLLMLFFIFITFWPLADFFEKYDFFGLLVVLILYTVGVVAMQFIDNYFMIWTALTYMPLFWIGVKLRQRGTRFIRMLPAFLWVIADVVLFWLVHYVFVGETALQTVLRLGGSFALHIIGALMAFVVFQQIADRSSKWKTSKLFSLLVRTSMPIYLIHQQIVYFLIAALNGHINPYLHVVINFVGALAISLPISLLLLRFRVTRFFIGEK